MKKTLILFIIVLFVSACAPKKTETTGVTDSLTVDSAVQATQPAPSILAFGAVPGFALNNKITLTDSVNFFLFRNQEELNMSFDVDKKSASEVDFIINYVVGVACKPSTKSSTIMIDKVEVVDKEINVYLNIQYGEKQRSVAVPSQVFAIEKRDGMIDIQLWVNGKKSQALMLM